MLAELGPTIHVLNPALVHGLKRVYADAGKTDRLDAFFLAERLRVGRLPTPFQPDLVYAPEAPVDPLPGAPGPNAGTREELLPGLAVPPVQRLQSRSSLRRCVRG
jgi:hypothetical protein